MRYTSSLATACLFASIALAAHAPPESSCVIYYGSSSVKNVPTAHHTTRTTITRTYIVPSTRTKTRHPSPTTSTTTITATETDTTTIQSTDTFTDVSTETTTVTTTLDTQTVTETDTATTLTTSTSTTILGTASGFTPVRSSLPDSSYDGAEGGPPPSKRSNAEFEDIEERAADPQPILRGKKYPQFVECTKTHTVRAPPVTVTRQRAHTTVTEERSTSIATSQTTTTTTTTEVENAETTVTSTTTSSSTSTVSPSTTTTTTTTVTNTEVATATGYAQCLYNNFADGINGQHGIYLLAANDGNYGVSNRGSIDNSLDCCNACAQDSSCSVSIYTSMSGGCYGLEGCGLHFPTVQDNSYDWVVNNGCGFVTPN